MRRAISSDQLRQEQHECCQDEVGLVLLDPNRVLDRDRRDGDQCSEDQRDPGSQLEGPPEEEDRSWSDDAQRKRQGNRPPGASRIEQDPAALHHRVARRGHAEVQGRAEPDLGREREPGIVVEESAVAPAWYSQGDADGHQEPEDHQHGSLARDPCQW